jgi:hypothetical protein
LRLKTRVCDETDNRRIRQRKGNKMTYYKVISKENKSCHGGDFDWTPYLPEENKPGKWTPEIKDTEECIKGYHVTQYWNMWYKKDCRIFKCEVKGCTCCEYPGVIGKEVCTSIRLVKEIFPVFDKNSNTGCWNTGDWNTGDCNTGNWNTGNRNTGDSNTGNRNTGDWNTGDWNTGNRNTGDRNTGDCNTGGYNTGDRNTGDGNVGDKHAGFLNIKPEPVIIFDKPFTGKLTDEIKELIYDLSYALMKNDPICPDSYLKIPNATIAKIKKLHQAHIDARNKENIL